MTLHFTTSQVAFRGYADDAGLGAATAKAAQNTGWTQTLDENFRVRFELQETGGVSGSFVPQLQYNRNGAGYVNVTGSSTVVRSTASPNVADGAATADLLTAGTGTFAAGAFDEVDGLTGTHTVAASGHTEVEFCVQLRSADVGGGDTIQLRVLGKANATTALDTYPQVPTVTVPSTPVLALNLDANALTGLVDLDPVATFTDQSAQSNTVTQATAGNQGTYRTARTPTGKAAVEFGGVDDYYEKGSAGTQTATQTFTWFAVFRLSSLAAHSSILSVGDVTGGRQWRINSAGTQELLKESVASLASGTLARTTGTWYIAAVRYGSGGAVTFWKTDGTTDGTATNSTTFTDVTANISAGRHPGNADYFAGDLAEIKAYNYARTDTEVTDELAALNTKWLQSANVTVNAGPAIVDFTAADATVATTGNTTVQAQAATLDFTAADATVSTGLTSPTTSAVPGMLVPGSAVLGVVPAVQAAPGAVQAQAATLSFTAADAVVAVAAPAAAATLDFTAADAVVAVGVSAGTATLPFIAADAVVAVTEPAEAAGVSFTAADATVAVAAGAEAAILSFTAADATVSTATAGTGAAQPATLDFTAADAAVAVVVPAAAATVDFTAADATVVAGAQAEAATLDFTAADAAVAVAVNAGSAAVSFTAADATVSTLAQTTVNAGPATLDFTAADAVIAAAVNAGPATVGFTAADATVSTAIVAVAGAATLDFLAVDAGIAVRVGADAATVSFTAAPATFQPYRDVSAEAALLSFTAADATVAVGVPAEAAAVSFTAADVTAYIPPPVPPPRWVEGDSTAAGLVEGELVGAGIVEGSASL